MDVCFGAGHFLIGAKEGSWEVYGFEFLPAAIDLCNSN